MHVLLPEGEPHVRPEELVRRADEDVDVPRLDVDAAVRPVVDGVGPGERADGMRELDDPPHVRRGADGVRRQRERDDARALRELALEIVVVEREVVVDVDEADDDAEVVLQLEPRRDVGVVVEPRHEHLFALAQRARERAREEEVERGHARPEGDLLVAAAEEVDRRGGGRARRARPSSATSRTARRRSRSTRACRRRSRRSPRPGTACRPGRRKTPVAAAAPSSVSVPTPTSSIVVVTWSDLLSVDVPDIGRFRGQRGADEAVALGLREQIAQGPRSRRGSNETSNATESATTANRPSSSRRVTVRARRRSP